MNRSLAIYLFILNFFLLLIAILLISMLFRGRMHLVEGFNWFSLLSPLITPLTSFVYVGYTYRSFKSMNKLTDSSIIDTPEVEETHQEYPIPGLVLLLGLISVLLSLGILGVALNNLYQQWKENNLGHMFESNKSISVILTVYLFNGVGQTTYFLRTFRNVKRKAGFPAPLPAENAE